MSALAGHDTVIQLDRGVLLAAIQTRMQLRGTSVQAPFRLHVQPEDSDPWIQQPSRALDLIFDAVNLTLEPGTRRGALLLNIAAGIVRLGAEDVAFTSGRVRIDLEFLDRTMFDMRLLGASLEGVSSQIPNFQTRADALVERLLGDEASRRIKPIPTQEDPIAVAIRDSIIHVIDSETIALARGAGRSTQLTRTILPGRTICLAMSAELIRNSFLCPSLLTPEQRDPSRIPGAPITPAERALLPPPCGTGHIATKDGPADVRITEIRFTFRDGHIEISGFDADATCATVRDGTFSQKLFLTLAPDGRTIVPHLEPDIPGVQVVVRVAFVCRAAAFLIGAFAPYIGGVLLGIGAYLAAGLIAALVDPEITGRRAPRQTLPQVVGVHLRSMAITENGLLFHGFVEQAFVPNKALYPGVRLRIASLPENLREGPGGVTDYQAPTCERRAFRYRSYHRDDVKELRGIPEWLILPVQYEWFLNDEAITRARPSPLRFVTSVRTAVPPPRGMTVSGYEVELAHNLGLPLPWGGSDGRLVLTPRSQDMCYGVRVTVRATDATGRTFLDGERVEFTGVWAEFGQDFDDYVDECFRRAQAVVDGKALVKERLEPGEPQMGVDVLARYIERHIAAGNSEAATVVTNVARVHGPAALNQALARVAEKLRF